ncbi:MAG: hypothetical protein KDB88_03310 [Flavobacteriales bacterium]|nr:hypothetical protein [Flavobacteriales bacterium]
MFVTKNITFKGILRFTGAHLVWLTLWAILVALFYEWVGDEWVPIPWLPISIIGTAVAFYVGFKNNSAYDRLWEARKIWGGIVNSSRSWATAVRSFVSDQFQEQAVAGDLHAIHGRLIYRHLAWLYALRAQLLVPTPWEHVSQGRHFRDHALRIRRQFGLNLQTDEETERCLREFLPKDELEPLINAQNTATQIIDRQSQELKALRKADLIDDFRHMELQKILNEFYTFQGQCERIKKFPLPRQYGAISLVFVGIFIFLLPLGLVSEFDKLGSWGVLLSIPFTVLVGWVYVTMELIGDYSENPFEGLANDVPMMALCRTIEIDLLEMLGETELPPPIEAKNGVLM